MRSGQFAWVPAVAAATLIASLAGAQSRTDSAFQQFWTARSPAEAERSAAEVTDSGVTFEDAFRRLKAGRRYQPATGGVVKFSNTSNGIEHYYAVNVPQNYDPSRRYQLRFQLHGGIGRRVTNQPVGTGEIGALAGDEQFYVLPYSWVDSPWWGDDQVLNLAAILDDLKRRYNIDENRIVLSGVSDGGTGAYYIGMRDTTPYASFTPLNGYIMVLANDDIDRGQLFPDNLRNKPMFVVNGGKDPLYPAARVRPSVEHLIQHGVEVAYHPQPEAVHNTAWWPEMKATYERFVAAHARDPHPDRLTWQTADLVHNRAHWLVIDQLGAAAGDAAAMPDMNVMTVGSTTYPIFSRRQPAGRVDLVRAGNRVEATTKGVAAFTLLLSPDKFDFNQPVQVVANGRTVFSGRVDKSVTTLMKWAARDNDRTMLYGAEVRVVLAR
jgi:poly(3-hydroxybutyrate) depolymerase